VCHSAGRRHQIISNLFYITISNIARYYSDRHLIVFLAFALTTNYYNQVLTLLNLAATAIPASASKYGVAVFLMLSSAVLGRVTHSILVWRLERGECIGVLGVLAGSNSLTSAMIL
jgi:hypothetical protein